MVSLRPSLPPGIDPLDILTPSAEPVQPKKGATLAPLPTDGGDDTPLPADGVDLPLPADGTNPSPLADNTVPAPADSTAPPLPTEDTDPAPAVNSTPSALPADGTDPPHLAGASGAPLGADVNITAETVDPRRVMINYLDTSAVGLVDPDLVLPGLCTHLSSLKKIILNILKMPQPSQRKIHSTT
jgi:hypothetical protein